MIKSGVRENLFLIIVSAAFSFCTLTLKKELYFDTTAVFNYIISSHFLMWLAVMSAACFFLLKLLSMAAPSKNRPPVAAAAVVFIILITLYFIKFFAIYIMCLNNAVFASLLFMLYYYLDLQPVTAGQDRVYIIAIILAAMLLGVMSFIRTFSYFNSFNTMTDMAIHINTIWQYSAGAPPYSWMEGTLGISHRIGVHFQPIVYLFAFIYRFLPFPGLLLFIQSALAFGGVVAFYLLAEKITQNSPAAFLLTLAFAISPFLAQAVDYDLHFDFLYIVALPLFLYFAESGMFWPAVISLIIGAAAKEEAAVYLAFASLFAWTRTKDRKYIYLSGLTIAYAAAVIFALMPAYSAYDSTHASKTIGLLAMSPRVFSGDIMGQFIICYLAGVLFLSLYPGPALLLLFLPPVCVHLLNTLNWSKLFFYQYHAFTLTALFVTAAYALAKKPFRLEPVPIAAAVLIMQIFLHMAYAPSGDLTGVVFSPALMFFILPALLAINTPRPRIKTAAVAAVVVLIFYSGYFTFNSRRGTADTAYVSAVEKALKLLPSDPDTPLVADANICSHAAARKYLTDPAYYHGGSFMVMNRISRIRAKEFYILSGGGSAEQTAEITGLALKFGYKCRDIFVEGPVKLSVFY